MTKNTAIIKTAEHERSCDSCEIPHKYNIKEDLINALMLVLLAFAFLRLFNLDWIFPKIFIRQEIGLLAMFLSGIAASISSCGATVGALLISLNKQWEGRGIKNTLAFLISRIVIFSFLGGIVGSMGYLINVSSRLMIILSILISVYMLFMAFDILDIKMFSVFKPRALNFSKNKKVGKDTTGLLFSIFLGAGTVLIPCGFTLSAFAASALTKNPLVGMETMFAFIMGSSILLFIITVIGKRLSSFNKAGAVMGSITGIFILLFSIHTITEQFKMLNLQSMFSKKGQVLSLSGAQKIEMEVTTNEYRPSQFTVKAGKKVIWEISSENANGCTSSLVAPGLFEGQLWLKPGVTIKEFTPEKVGKYNFSCWMGMVNGTIDVIE